MIGRIILTFDLNYCDNAKEELDLISSGIIQFLDSRDQLPRSEKRVLEKED